MIERESAVQLEWWRHASRLSGGSQAGTGAPNPLDQASTMREMLSPSDVQLDT